MELFAKLFSSLLALVYHCFDRIVIHRYLSGLSRPEQVVYLFREVIGVRVASSAELAHRRLPQLGRAVCSQPQEPEPSHPGAPAEPLHPLLLLHSR